MVMVQLIPLHPPDKELNMSAGISYFIGKKDFFEEE
jgi:hypothetical protein